VRRHISIVPDPAVLLEEPGKKRRKLHGAARIGVICAASGFPKRFIELMTNSAKTIAQHINPEIVRVSDHLEERRCDGDGYSGELVRYLRPLSEFGDVQVCGLRNMYEDNIVAEQVARQLRIPPGPHFSRAVFVFRKPQ